jgi:hypothetical protein
MPAMLSKLYHALLGAGVDDATATAAAEEAAQSDQRFAVIDVKLAEIHGELDRRFAHVETRFTRLEGEMERRFTQLEAHADRRFAQVDGRFATVEGQIGRTLDAVKALSERLDSHFRIIYWILGIMGTAILGLIWRLVA